jgi:hypothetical protein
VRDFLTLAHRKWSNAGRDSKARAREIYALNDYVSRRGQVVDGDYRAAARLAHVCVREGYGTGRRGNFRGLCRQQRDRAEERKENSEQQYPAHQNLHKTSLTELLKLD